jgi:hypothetical protein
MNIFSFSKQYMHNNIFLQKKPPPYERGGIFINENCVIFKVFFCLVMFHESQTWDFMTINKMCVCVCVCVCVYI